VPVLLPVARFVLGLCDGNHCESGEAGRDRGNGRIVVALFMEHSPPRNHCHWVPEKVISIPETAGFTAYAGLAIRGNQLLISSKVWFCKGCTAACKAYCCPSRDEECMATRRAILSSLCLHGTVDEGLPVCAPAARAHGSQQEP